MKSVPLPCLALCLLLPALSIAQVPGSLRGVHFGVEGPVLRAILDVDSNGEVNAGRLRAPARIYVDLRHVTIAGSLRERDFIPPQVPLVTRLRLSQFDASTTRVVLDLNELAEFSIVRKPQLGQVWIEIFPTASQASGQLASPQLTTHLRGVRVESDGGIGRLTVDLDGEAQVRVGTLRSPDRAYVDLIGVAALRESGDPDFVPGTDSLVERMRVSQFNSVTTRIVLDLRGPCVIDITRPSELSRLQIDLRSTSLPIQKNDHVDLPAETSVSRRDFRMPETIFKPTPIPDPPSLPGGGTFALLAIVPVVPPSAPSNLVIPSEELPVVASGNSLVIRRVSTEPVLADFLNKQPRQFAKVPIFRQRIPRDGQPATQQTEAYIAYDDRNLYVAFVCRDDPARIRAQLSKREQIRNDDAVSVYLDTFADGQRAYVFTANPLGIQLDGVKYEGRKEEDDNFDTVWRSDGRLTQNGYVVLMSIPFKSLRFPGGGRPGWGIALRRRIKRNSEESYWPYITDRVQGLVGQFARLYGLDNIKRPRNVQFVPYAALTGARFLDTKVSPPFRTEHELRAGLDAKIVLGDAFTVDTTLNPDFSQVESDDPQVTFNQRFEVFFPEKRPFFTENANYFETPLNLFFSRRIVDPTAGMRLTGKKGGWALGALAADDRAAGTRFGTRNVSQETSAKIAVARVQREFGRQSRVGALATSHNWNGQSNQTFSVDTRLRLNTQWFFTGQVARSRTSRPGQPNREGSAYFADLTRAGRNFNYSASYTEFTPLFQTDIGFVKRVDIRTGSQYASYRWWTESSVLQSFGPTVNALVNYDHAGRMQDWFVQADFDFQFTRQTAITLSRSEAYEYYERGFRRARNAVTFYTGWTRSIAVSGSYGFGTALNYAPPSGLSSFLAGSRDASVTLALRPSGRLSFDQLYIYSRLGEPHELARAQTNEQGTIFNNHLFRSRINYQFTKALSLRGIVDYYAVLPNLRLTSGSDFRRLTADILLTYMVHPGTALHIGYNNRVDNILLDDPLNPTKLFWASMPRTSTSRQFFVKLSYLLRY